MTSHDRTRLISLAALLALLTLLLAGCTAPDGNPADGERWYGMHHCFSCHGPNGDDGKGPKIRGTGISYRVFQAAVRNANSPIMPKFPESKVPKQDVADMYAWLNEK